MKMLTEAECEALRWQGLRDHLARQAEWSAKTFGPGPRVAGVVDHIRKELVEVELCDGRDLEEWIDVVILALDGAWRMGATPERIIAQLLAKQAKNEARQWPDWRTMPAGKAIEHVRERPDPTVNFEGFVANAVAEAIANLPENPTPEYFVAKSAGRLQRLVDMAAPSVIIEHEKRILMRRVDALPVYAPDFVPINEADSDGGEAD